MHARVATPFKASYRAYRLFACVHWVVEAAPPVGAAFLTVLHAEGKSDRSMRDVINALPIATAPSHVLRLAENAEKLSQNSHNCSESSAIKVG